VFGKKVFWTDRERSSGKAERGTLEVLATTNVMATELTGMRMGGSGQVNGKMTCRTVSAATYCRMASR